MPQPRKPSDVLERNGSFAHDPKRRRKDPKGVGALPTDPPEWLDLEKHEERVWRQIVPLIPQGVGTGSDVFVIEQAVRLIARIRRTREQKAADVGQLRALLGSLGLSPSDRARLSMPAAVEDHEGFGEFAPGTAATAAPANSSSNLRAFKPRKR